MTEYLKENAVEDCGDHEDAETVFYSHPLEVCLFENSYWLKDWEFAFETYLALCGNAWKYVGGEDLSEDLRLYHGKPFKYLAELVINIRDRGEEIEDFYCRADHTYREGVITMRVKRFLNWLGWEYTGLGFEWTP